MIIGGLTLSGNTKGRSVNPEPLDTTPFRIGQFGCPHSDKDIEAEGRYPFTRGAEATIAAGKICDVYHVLGDWTGLQSVTESAKVDAITRISSDINGARNAVVNQGKAFDIKSITGNHISEKSVNPFDLYQRAVHNTIINMGPLPHPEVQDPGSNYPWESYYYVKGNSLFYFLGDRNDMETPFGKKDSNDNGGHPAGAILKSSLEHFIDVAIKHSDKNVFLHTHQGLPNTVVGTHTSINAWRGHNNYPLAVKQFKGTIGGLYVQPDNQNTSGQFEDAEPIFDLILNQWKRLVVGCANSHTHAPVNYKANPEFTGITSLQDRSNHEIQANLAVDDTNEIASANNDHFSSIGDSFVMNVGNLTKHHSDARMLQENKAVGGVHPHGTIWEFVPGSSTLKSYKLIVEDARVNGMNPNDAPIDLVSGQLYDGYYKEYQLKYPFLSEYTAVNPIRPSLPVVTSSNRNGTQVSISFEGNASGFAIVASDTPVDFQPQDDQTYVPSYEVASGQTLVYQGNSKQVILDTTKTYFKLYALNGGNGKVFYSSGISINV